jgi:MFS superfamily sulfate permease-like transporter
MSETDGADRDTRAAAAPRNRFDRMEWAGAFGDLGTLIPFAAAYIGVLKLDPMGVLFAFGAAMVVCGLYYKTPFPVQPMKAIGAVAATQAAQTAVITSGAVYAAGLVTGAVWLVLGLTGLAEKLSKLAPRPVVIGIILGLGMGFMLEGVRMMALNWIVASVGLAGTVLLLTNRKVPAMFALLLAGAAYGAVERPELVSEIARAGITPRLPGFALTAISWNDLWIGALFLALPQMPLTFGNAVVAVTEENNRLFPDRKVGERKVSISTGIMNLLGASVGGVPMCHGAGGMAGHVRFGARTGGAPIILGSILLVLAIFFSGSVETLFRIFPLPVLGVILFLTGAQLALGACDFGKDKGDRFVTLIVAAFAMWNVGLAFVAGLACHFIKERGLLKL